MVNVVDENITKRTKLHTSLKNLETKLFILKNYSSKLNINPKYKDKKVIKLNLYHIVVV